MKKGNGICDSCFGHFNNANIMYASEIPQVGCNKPWQDACECNRATCKFHFDEDDYYACDEFIFCDECFADYNKVVENLERYIKTFSKEKCRHPKIEHEVYQDPNGSGDYRKYTKKRDAHIYELWKNGKKQSWLAEYIGRSKERVRQIINKAEKKEIIDVNGNDMYYEMYGTEGVPLVLVSGLSRDHSIWDTVIEHLKKHFRIIVFDNRGTGRSYKPLGPYTTERMSEDLYYLLKTLGINKAHILGHSLGGFIAQYFAINHPYMVEKLILLATRAKQSAAGKKYLTDCIENYQNSNSKKEFLSYLLPMIYSKKFLTIDKVNAIIKNVESHPYPQPGYAYIAQVQACINHNTEEIVQNIKAETLIIAGEEDKIMSIEDSEYMKEEIPNSYLEMVPKSGHMIQIEKPEILCQLIKSFLKQETL